MIETVVVVGPLYRISSGHMGWRADISARESGHFLSTAPTPLGSALHPARYWRANAANLLLRHLVDFTDVGQLACSRGIGPKSRSTGDRSVDGLCSSVSGTVARPADPISSVVAVHGAGEVRVWSVGGVVVLGDWCGNGCFRVVVLGNGPESGDGPPLRRGPREAQVPTRDAREPAAARRRRRRDCASLKPPRLIAWRQADNGSQEFGMPTTCRDSRASPTLSLRRRRSSQPPRVAELAASNPVRRASSGRRRLAMHLRSGQNTSTGVPKVSGTPHRSRVHGVSRRPMPRSKQMDRGASWQLGPWMVSSTRTPRSFLPTLRHAPILQAPEAERNPERLTGRQGRS